MKTTVAGGGRGGERMKRDMQEIIGSKEVSNSQNTPKNLPSLCSWPISPGLPGILAVDPWGRQCPFLGQLSHVMPSVRSAALQPKQTFTDWGVYREPVRTASLFCDSIAKTTSLEVGQESAFKFLCWFSLCWVGFFLLFKQKFRVHMCLLLDNVLK